MPRKKIEKPTRRTRKVRTEKTTIHEEAVTKKTFGISQWKWGESYTSFLLGLVVVVIGVLFGVTLIRQHRNIQETSSIQATPAVTTIPTNTPTQLNEGQKTYTVRQGDDLWNIAEKFYQSGYNWVDIAKANNLSDPSTIHVGNVLVIPSVTPGAKTVTPTPTQVAQTNAISGNTYTVEKGDDLWHIAVRAYGNGYKWVDIAKANNLSDPSLIFSGNVLTIPR